MAYLFSTILKTVSQIRHNILFIPPPPPFRFQLEKETSFTTKKGRSVDNSIVRAYTEAIRRAKRFIYVENQYFMGSAYGWLDDQVMRFPT